MSRAWNWSTHGHTLISSLYLFWLIKLNESETNSNTYNFLSTFLREIIFHPLFLFKHNLECQFGNHHLLFCKGNWTVLLLPVASSTPSSNFTFLEAIFSVFSLLKFKTNIKMHLLQFHEISYQLLQLRL